MFRSIVDEFGRDKRWSLVGFTLFWSLISGFGIVGTAVGAAQQITSAGWPSTEGTITVSEIARSSKGRWELAYEYAVAGRPYTGKSYSFAPMPIQGKEEILRHI